MPPQVATRLSRCVSYEESHLVYLTVHYWSFPSRKRVGHNVATTRNIVTCRRMRAEVARRQTRDCTSECRQ